MKNWMDQVLNTLESWRGLPFSSASFISVYRRMLTDMYANKVDPVSAANQIVMIQMSGSP